MRRISTREFGKHVSKELNDLPLIITKYNKPIAVVRSPEDFLWGGGKTMAEHLEKPKQYLVTVEEV